MENLSQSLELIDKSKFVEFILKSNHLNEFLKFNSNKSNLIEINCDKLQKKQSKIEKQHKRLDFTLTKHFAFKFGYIGKNYEGLVIQKHTKNTVEDKIINSLIKASLIENFENSNYSRCGRTDSGVSAVGNVFSVTLRYKENLDYIKVLNNLLPNDIRIYSYSEVDDSFDARFSCLYREYNYYFIKNNMDINKIKIGAEKLKGVHNFKNFCKIDKNEKHDKNFERRIYKFSIEKVDKLFFLSPNEEQCENLDMYVAVIQGSAFLWHQVRCMMAILFLIGNGLEDISVIDTLLDKDFLEDNKIHYEIASNFPLILSNCQFEGVTFQNNLCNIGETFIDLKSIYEQNLMDLCITSRMFNYLRNVSMPIYLEKDQSKQKESNDLWKFIIKVSQKPKGKYTKLLNIKRNKSN